MKKIKIFTESKYRTQSAINKWIEKEKPNIISVNGADDTQDNLTTYILYDDSKTFDDLLKS